MHRRAASGVAAAGITGVILAVALSASAAPQTARVEPFRIERLVGSVFRYGTWSGGTVWAVRLRATLCDRSPPKGGRYLSEFDITHFAVSRERGTWYPARKVLDRPAWLVPLNETWIGRPCGPVTLEDAVPPEHYAIESLGNPRECYGVGLTIRAGAVSASRRVIVTCRPPWR
jgi:hypothetical protein